MRKLLTLLLLTLAPLHAAQTGGIFVAADSTGNRARPSGVIITNTTSMLVPGDLTVIGTLTATGVVATATGRAVSFVVAAVDAPTAWIAGANYVCDGVADQVQLQTAISAAEAQGGGSILLSPGTFVWSAGVTNGSNVSLLGSPGSFINATGVPNSTTLFTALGNQASGNLLTANGDQGDTSIAVTAGVEAAFSAGDYIKVGATNIITPDTGENRTGEIAIVASTSSGVINVRWPLQDNYTTANAAFVARMTMVTNVAYRNFTIFGKGTNSTSVGFLLDCVARSVIEGVHIYNIDEAFVRFNDVVFSKVEDAVLVGGTSGQNTHYGVALNFATADCTVVNSNFREMRHAVTTGGSANLRTGVPRRLTVVNCKSEDTTSGSFDTHSAVEQISFIGCISLRPNGASFNIRGSSASIIGCRSVDANPGIWIRNESYLPSRVIIANCDIDRPLGRGIQVLNPLDIVFAGTTVSSNISYVKITGCAINSPADMGIWVESDQVFPLRNVTIEGTSIFNCADANGQAIQVQNCEVVSLKDLTITQLGSTTDAVRLETCNYVNVDGLLASWDSAPAGEFGIRGLDAHHVMVSGLIVRNGTRAVSWDNDCSYNTIARLDDLSCTSDVSLGTGVGHSISRPPLVQTFTVGTHTWTNRAGAKSVSIQLIGGGGGGGSGRKGAGTNVRAGGGGGGGGSIFATTIDAALLGTLVTIDVGAGGGGGAAQTANDNDGVSGTNGASTTFVVGSLSFAGRAGTGGGGGTAAAGTAGSGGAGLFTGGNGGAASGTGGAGVAASSGQNGGGGGGSGGGITSGDAESVGGAGAAGSRAYSGSPTAGTAGTAGGGAGGNGAPATTSHIFGGAGGGGGGSALAANGGAGGDGGIYGAGGGGGGASVNSVGDSGAGGDGAPGLAVIITYF